MTGEFVHSQETYKHDLFRDILTEAIRITATSPLREDAISEEMIIGWRAEALPETAGTSIPRFFVYNEHRPQSAILIDEEFGSSPPFADFVLPHVTDDDGAPTQRLYFLHRDFTIESYIERLVLDSAGECIDYSDLSHITDLSVTEREELLEELRGIELLT